MVLSVPRFGALFQFDLMEIELQIRLILEAPDLAFSFDSIYLSKNSEAVTGIVKFSYSLVCCSEYAGLGK